MLKAIAGGGSVSIAGLARFGSGVPSNGLGSDGDGYIRFDSPYAGLQYSKTSGTWAVAQAAVAWASRPSAASNPNGIITVSDLGNQDFYSDGTNWIPIGKRMLFTRVTAASQSRTVGTAASQTAATISIPAGLIIPGCQLDFKWLFDFLGTGASTKNIILDDSLGSGVFLWNNNVIAANIKAHSDSVSLRVGDSATTFSWAIPNGGTGDSTAAAGSTGNAKQYTIDVSSAHNWRFRIITAVDEQWQLANYSLTILYK